MIGKRIVLDLPECVPLQTDHRTVYRCGDEGLVVGTHRFLDAWLVIVRDTTIVLFPDEIKEL